MFFKWYYVLMFKAYRSYWRNASNFRDRTSRAGYWWVFFVNIVIGAALFVFMYISISGAGFGSVNRHDTFSTLAPVVILVAWPFVNIIPSVALTIRRLHDTGRSAVYYLCSLIPVAGTLIMVYFLASETKTPPDNRYFYRRQV